MSDASGTDKRTAAQHLASVWGDGKRRIVVARRTSFRVGQQTLTYDPTQVIDDPHTIALIEEHGVDYVDLEVNGRPKRGKGLIDAEVDVNKNIDAIADALGIPQAQLHDAIENGGVERIAVVTKSVEKNIEPFRSQWKIDLEFPAERLALADKIDATLAGAISDEGLHEAIELLKESSRVLRGEPPAEPQEGDESAPSDEALTGQE